MNETKTESYIGQGVMYIDGRDVGEASSINFSIEQETKELPSNRGGGGNADEITKVKSVKLSATLNTFSNENLALALRGKVSVLTATAITDEIVSAKLGGLADTKLMIDVAETVTVKPATGSVALVAGTDFIVSAAGIRALTGGAITEGENIKVTYKSKAGNALEALVESGREVKVVIDGINDSTGKPWTLKVHRWKPSPASGLDLIGTDYGSFDIEGGALADPSIVATGKSKFFVRTAA